MAQGVFCRMNLPPLVLLLVALLASVGARAQAGPVQTQNAYVERFNGSFRRELLNDYLFATLRQVREHCQLWQYDYNHLRPHEALNFLTPIEFRQAT